MNVLKRWCCLVVYFVRLLLFFSAGLHIYTTILTKVTVFLDNGSRREINVAPARPYKVDARFAGFERIQWEDPNNGNIYICILDIAGYKNWFDIDIGNGYILLYDQVAKTKQKLYASIIGSVAYQRGIHAAHN